MISIAWAKFQLSYSVYNHFEVNGMKWLWYEVTVIRHLQMLLALSSQQ